MTEQIWDNFARLNAGERYRAQSAEMGAAVTVAVVEAARLEAGMRVLDVACGSGEPAISMAEQLRGTGTVTGVDMAAGPLAVARERARARGLENVEFRQGDVHGLELDGASFDRVTSRLGVMFFADLAQALREMHRVLKPGGRVALLTWGRMEQPYFASKIGVARGLRPELELPATGQKMFQFGEAGRLSGALRAAGFGKVEEELHRLPWDWRGSPEELWEYFRAVTVPFHPLLEKVAGDAEVDRAVLAELGRDYDGEYVRCTAEMVLAVGER